MKTPIIIAATVIIVVVAGSILLFGHKKSPGNQNNQVQNEQNNSEGQNENQDQNREMAFADYLSQAGPQECTVTQQVENLQSQGKVWIEGENARGDLTTSYGGQSIKASFIVRDGYTYTWSDALSNGIKTKNVPGSPSGISSGSYNWNPANVSNYECKPWAPDASRFELPEGKNFRTVAP